MPSTTLPPPQQSEIDKTTGFLEFNRHDAFSASHKVEFLKRYRETLNMSEAAESVGFHRATIMHHIDSDRAFAGAVAQAKMAIADELVHVAQRVARKDEGVRDRWNLIERMNPTEFGKADSAPPTVNIVIDGKVLENAQTQANAIEAEVLSSYTESTTGTLPPSTSPQ